MPAIAGDKTGIGASRGRCRYWRLQPEQPGLSGSAAIRFAIACRVTGQRGAKGAFQGGAKPG
ncbi:hypothetical protein [Oxalobacter paraformigenes]|uniref:hypothetical protein n=1 Tax=Oxalobacter paraformigenes TaxID=556268 RepID=UPI00030C29B7|nr:hypothetical protein [Oxalobacter paraformigenes]